ncbi:hypothetical protein L484_020639 [Morus notabilis]|uniref:BHLH domain-containing protein n=1 Tax=Morus notabilis TaxID=981085 RepID=W9S980_9ROSA|nr:hypothetical protein L484_020639 [Morus notabilis]
MYAGDDALLPTSTTNPVTHNVNGLEPLDFFDGSNDNIDDQFVNLIHGETEINPFVDFGHCDDRLINGCLDNNQFGGLAIPGNDHVFGTFNAVADLNSGHDHDDQDPDEEEDKDNNDVRQESSETNTGSTSTAKTNKSKADRSRTLISERRRRGRMKDKLYALRSLVPNITKMDKASIVGDAVRYVQELQTQAKKLKDEISGLEASLLGPDRSYQASIYSTSNNQRKFQHFVANTNQLISKNVMQMDMFQVDERGFYMRLVCNKGDGIAASLYKALESLTSFNVQSSNLASATDRLELTLTLRVKDNVREMSLPNLKLWLVGALLNEGFEFK